MADDNDKTVFKQPMPGGDRTSLRPTPGRRTGQTELGRRPQQPLAGAGQIQTPSRAEGGRGSYDVAKFAATFGLNPLVNCASTLLAVFERTRGAVRHPDVGGLHKRLINEIRSFEQNAKDDGIKPEIILAARYLLCSVVDEAVLHTPWGGESAWAQNTLLTLFHNETSGGEKCFAILDRMLHAPAENRDMLELLYLCISLGFEGKYRLINRGRDQLETLRDELFRTIRTYRGDYERTLSPSWQGLGHTRKTLTQMMPLWVAASIFGLIVFAGYGGFSYWMRSASDPVVEDLAVIAGQSKDASPLAPSAATQALPESLRP